MHLEFLLASAGLTIAANVAVATGPSLFGALQSFLCSLFFIAYKGGYIRIQVPEASSEMGIYILHLLYRNFIRRKRFKFQAQRT